MKSETIPLVEAKLTFNPEINVIGYRCISGRGRGLKEIASVISVYICQTSESA